MTHTELIYNSCRVIAHTDIFGVEVIWYIDDGCGVLETFEADGTHEMYSCDTKDDYDLIVSMI